MQGGRHVLVHGCAHRLAAWSAIVLMKVIVASDDGAGVMEGPTA